MSVAQDLQRLLSRFGYDSHLAKTGEAALVHGNGSCPDAILMDIALSGKLDGIQTAEQLQRTKKAVPIIFVTASWAKYTRQRLDGIWHAGVVSKPFAEEELRQALHQVFNFDGSPNPIHPRH